MHLLRRIAKLNDYLHLQLSLILLNSFDEENDMMGLLKFSHKHTLPFLYSIFVEGTIASVAEKKLQNKVVYDGYKNYILQRMKNFVSITKALPINLTYFSNQWLHQFLIDISSNSMMVEESQATFIVSTQQQQFLESVIKNVQLSKFTHFQVKFYFVLYF